MKSKMKPYFRTLQGGLFSKVNKADVGGNADAMKANHIAMLCWADPFFPDDKLDPDVKQVLAASLEDGSAQHYTTPIGNSDLKAVIAEKLREDNHLEVDPQRNIIITPGSDSALFFSLLPFIEPGDEVLIVDPSYPNNFQAVEALGGVPVGVPVRPETGYEIEIEAFENRLTEKTKLVLFTNPNNPTTVVYSRETLQQLADFVIKNDLLAIVDQAFEDIIFDEKEMVTLASLEGMWERTVTLFSISKGLGLSGLRVGYIVATDELMDILYASAVSVIGASNSSAQLAAITALKKRKIFIEDYRRQFDRRRTILFEHLSDVPGVQIQLPQSAFLSWIDISRLGTSDEIVDYLVEDARVFVNAGNCYGSQGEGHLRIVQGCYADEQTLQDAIKRIRMSLMKKSKQLGIK